MNTTTRTQMAYEAHRKSMGISYLLWFFLGGLGMHRFYLGENKTGAIQLGLALLGWLPLLLGWVALGVWLIVDIFLIPGMVEKRNQETMKTIASVSGDPAPQRTTRKLEESAPQPAPAPSNDPRVEEIRRLSR